MFVRSLRLRPRAAVARAAFAPFPSRLPQISTFSSPSRAYASHVSVNGLTQLKPTIYGQPLAPSHPHLLRKHETTPGIPQEEYDRRRGELMESLPDGSAVVCVAGQVKYMSGREYSALYPCHALWYPCP